MSLNRFWMLALLPLLVSCGSGDDEKTLSVPYGMVFTVNGERDVTAITIDQALLDEDSDYTEACNTDNIGTVPTEVQDVYCDNERITGAAVFQFRFINNTLESMPISFPGVGVTIQIERRTSTDPELWEVVWDSDAFVDAQYKIVDMDYQPQELNPLTELAPAESYPNQDYYALTFSFLTDRNFTDTNGNGVYDKGVDTLIGNPSDYCGWYRTYNSTTETYDKLLCQTEALTFSEPVVYRANVHYHFDFDGELPDPAPVIITVNPYESE